MSIRRRQNLQWISRHFSGNASSVGNSRHHQLEVERKFLATPSAISYLRSNGGGSRFEFFESLGKQKTHDVYYDRDNLLLSRGVYVRQRNGNWEAKVRSGGDFINSAFREIEGYTAVKILVETNLNITTNTSSIEDIVKPFVDFVTERESWMIDKKFHVDIDETDFGHVVGEVELTRLIQFSDNEHEQEKRLWGKMNREIEIFMQSCPQAFPAGKPIGKLSAYFRWKQSLASK